MIAKKKFNNFMKTHINGAHVCTYIEHGYLCYSMRFN